MTRQCLLLLLFEESAVDPLARGLAAAALALTLANFVWSYSRSRALKREQQTRQREQEAAEEARRQSQAQEDRQREERSRPRVTLEASVHSDQVGPALRVKVHNPCSFPIPIQSVVLKSTRPVHQVPGM